jgi:hypothetical protein
MASISPPSFWHGLTADVIGLIVGMFALGAPPAGVSNGTLAARVPEQRLAVLGLAGVAGIVWSSRSPHSRGRPRY